MTSSITHPRQFTESGAEVLQPEGWPIPRGYANGLMAEGRLIVTGGVVGWDERGAFPEGFVAQARQVFQNIRARYFRGGWRGAATHRAVDLVCGGY